MENNMNKITSKLQKSTSLYKYNFKDSSSTTDTITFEDLEKVNNRIRDKIKQNEIIRAKSEEEAGKHIIR